MMVNADAVFIDTNVLLTACVPARSLHDVARLILDKWPGEGVRLLSSGQVFREYLAVATRPTQLNGLGLALQPST